MGTQVWLDQALWLPPPKRRKAKPLLPPPLKRRRKAKLLLLPPLLKKRRKAKPPLHPKAKRRSDLAIASHDSTKRLIEFDGFMNRNGEFHEGASDLIRLLPRSFER